MRAKEFINEAQNLAKVVQQAGIYAKRYDDLDQYYDMYRLGIAIAGGDIHPVDGKGTAGDNPTVWMYAPEEADKIKTAEKHQGIKGTTIIGKGQSAELDTINKKSPTATRKPNKYGV
jgi:hypothetical protein